MAFNFKTATPDATLPDAGFILGADSQAATTPSAYPVTALDGRVSAAVSDALTPYSTTSEMNDAISDAVAGVESGATGIFPYSYVAAGGSTSLAHLPTAGHAVNQVFFTGFWTDDEEECSCGRWRIVGSSNLGPVGSIGYRTFYGSALPGSPTVLSTLSSMGFIAGDTVTINSQTVTIVTSGASGNNQANVTDRLQNLAEKLNTLLVSNLGDGVRLEVISNRMNISSADINNIVTTASLTISGTGIDNLGLVAGTYPFERGITMEGENWRFEYLPGAGGEVDIRALGIVCDGVTVADYRRLRRLASAAAARGYKLVNNYGTYGRFEGGRVKLDRTWDLRRCSCDLRIQAGTPVDATTASQDGDFFDEAAYLQYLDDLADWVTAGSNPDTEPVNPNIGIEIFSYDYLGATRYVGIAAIGAGDASNSFSCRQYIDVRGDGNFDFTTRATCVGATFLDDNAAMGEYKALGSYCDIACVFGGNLEKQRPYMKGVYCNFIGLAWFTLVGSNRTPDTLEAFIDGNDCKHVVWELDNTDQSLKYNINFESQADTGDQSPAIWLRSGKFSEAVGRIRGANGDTPDAGPFILVDKTSNVGTDFVKFGLTFIHGAQTLIEIRRCRGVMGTVDIKDSDDPTQATTPKPVVWVKRVGDMSGFRCHMVAITTNDISILSRVTPAVWIGDTATDVAANGLYPYGANLGEWFIQAGNTFPFNSDGTEKTPDATAFPVTNYNALRLIKMKGGQIKMSGKGNIVVDTDVSASAMGNPLIIIDRENRRYTRTGAGVANVDFVCEDQAPV